MALLPILPVILLAVLFATLAARLVRSGVASDGSELWLGIFFAFIGLSAPLRASAAMGVSIGLDPALANMLGQVVTGSGMLCLNYFVRKVFRPEGRAGAILFSALAVLIVTSIFLFVVLGAHSRQSHPVNMLVVAAMMLSLGWAFGESLRYWLMMRKRVTLGLGDPIIANRFGLWTAWTGALLAFPVFNLGVRCFAFASGAASQGTQVAGEFAWAMDVARLLAATAGPTVAVCSWLIFFPPQRYLDRIAARAH